MVSALDSRTQDLRPEPGWGYYFAMFYGKAVGINVCTGKSLGNFKM